MHTHLETETGTWQLSQRHPTALREQRVVGRKSRDGAVQIDDERTDARRRILCADRTCDERDR